MKVVKGCSFIKDWTFVYLEGYRERDEYDMVKRTVGKFASFLADSGININRHATPPEESNPQSRIRTSSMHSRSLPTFSPSRSS